MYRSETFHQSVLHAPLVVSDRRSAQCWLPRATHMSPLLGAHSQSHVKTTNFHPAESRRRHFSQSAAARVCTTPFGRWTAGEDDRRKRAHSRPGCARSRHRQSDKAGNRRRDAATRQPCDIHRTPEDLGRTQGSRDFRVPPFHTREGKSRGDGLRLFRTSFSPCERGIAVEPSSGSGAVCACGLKRAEPHIRAQAGI